MKARNTLFLLFILISTNAFAEVVSFTISDSFPANKLMQENHVYKNSAVFENMGVYEGIVYAKARYRDIPRYCEAGYYMPDGSDTCVICDTNHYCVGGENAVAQPCPDNMVSQVGTSSVDDCGKIMRVGDDSLYLTQTKQTSPAFAITIGDKTFYGRMTPVSEGVKSITAGTTHSMHTIYNDVEYTIHDASAEDIVKE